jgi:hypothetical protein
VTARRFDDDEDLYDPAYPRHMKVVRDGGRASVPVMLTDSASRRVPLMDARAREHQRLLDGYSRIGAAAAQGTAGHRPGQVSLSDSVVRNARSRSEFARAEWIRKMQDQWSSPAGGIPRSPSDDDDGGDNGGDPVDAARQDYIRRITTDYQRGVVAGPTPSGAAYGPPGPYARGAWASQAAVDPRSPDMWSQVERARRRVTMEGNDAGEDAKAQAWSDYCTRIANDWRR